VSQAGYNTVLELLAHRVRAVVVPYEGSGDEQPLRAGLLAERGLLEVVPEPALSPARLAAAMDATLGRPDFPAPARLDLDGATRSVEILAELAAGVRAARGQGAARRS
jgi:predicted glycosyltransferase